MTRQLCTFMVGGLLLGVDVSSVQEVLRQQEMTPVPLAPRAVRGLLNLRGLVVTAVDLRTRLGFPDRPAAESFVNIITTSEDGVVSFLVDDVGDLVEVDAHCFEHAPETMSAAFRALVPGMFKLDGQLLFLLDPQSAAALTKNQDATSKPSGEKEKS